jgi:hypothetical protein
MSKLKLAGEEGSLNAEPSIRQFREQIGALVDALRQIGGNANVIAGSLEQADPFTSPFTLYVNPYIGSDRFVGGSYNTHESGETDEEIIASKLKRIELQRLECGYTPYRPFKTINRAVIEAAIITSKNWYSYTDPRAHLDCVSIVLAPGVHIVYNDRGSENASLASWGDEKDPTIEDLVEFNPPSVGGLLLPRGCSLCGPDLRKTTLRPNWVPPFNNEQANYQNRRAVLKVTGTGYFFGYTGMDKIGYNQSHHLLDLHGPASKDELDLFYSKCESAVGEGADLASAYLRARSTEYEIVGPIVAGELPNSDWDTTASASPYIFNCSIRSDYGLGGAFWDGDKVSGLKSMVCANFTGVSLQKDMRCWQIYENRNWVNLDNTPSDYQRYIDAPPDNVRMNPGRLSRHISAVNDAFIQEVSVFAIGQAIHHFTDRGGEITVTNSNSSFGGCAAVSRGYKSFAFPQDKNWSIGRIRVPLNVGEKVGNVRRIQLGVVSEINANRIILSIPLAADETDEGTPAILARDQYTFRPGTKIWIENPSGDDWRADIPENAWRSSNGARINIATPFVDSKSGDEAIPASVVGKRVYIRRLVDTRTPFERRTSIQLNNTASARLPERGFVLQTDPGRAGGGIQRQLAVGGSEVVVVSSSGVGPRPSSGVTKTAEVTLRRASASVSYVNGSYYRAGAIVKHEGKHYQSLKDQVASAESPDFRTWSETFVHMPSDYNPEDLQRNESPIITFDTDEDNSPDSQTCGINFASVWTGTGNIRDQYRSGTDYLGVHAFLVALGFTSAAAHAALVPQGASSRDRTPTNSSQFPVAPSGGAATGLAFWSVEFRRPSVLRLYGHAWEWAGYLNYSKSIPAAQKDLGPQNKFTYLFTSVEGGRVVPQGSNEEGFNVSPRGLEDIETGATLTVDAIGNSTLDNNLVTDFPNGLSASDVLVRGILTIEGDVVFPSISAAQVKKLGPIELASFDDIVATGSDAPVAFDDNSINARPEAVTIGALNRWRQAQRLISADTGEITIYVRAGATDRNLNQMFRFPPSSSDNAVPTLRRAAEYANAVIGGSNRTAVIWIAPGLYDPESSWDCNVRFEARDSANRDWPLIFPGNDAGNANRDNNYFDGTKFGNISERVNFTAFTLSMRSPELSGNALEVGVFARVMRFRKSVVFRGGFNFLGIPHLIRAVAQGELPQNRFYIGPPLPNSAYTSTIGGSDASVRNVNVFLRVLRQQTRRTAGYVSYTNRSPITLEGGPGDVADIKDCCFGSILPSHKESVGAGRDPYIATNGIVGIKLSNIYIIGATEIDSQVIQVNNAIPGSNQAHYGNTAVLADWTWRMTHHTFIGALESGTGTVLISELGRGDVFYLENPSNSYTRVFYQSGSKYLPNHIHLLTINGTEPTNDNTGPFFDQFIHAANGLQCGYAFSRAHGFARDTGRPFSSGFVGRFGRNGYNSVKTRGVLLGNQGNFDEERGSTVKLSVEARTVRLANEQAYTLFKVAGASNSNIEQFMPAYSNPPPASFGEPLPLGPADKKYNPVITLPAPSVAGAQSPLALNIGLRSYARGISPEHGFNITPNVIL